MTALLAHQVLRRRSAARLSGWVAAFYPPGVLICGWSYAEQFALLCLLGAASLCRWPFAGGPQSLVVLGGMVRVGLLARDGDVSCAPRPSAFCFS